MSDSLNAALQDNYTLKAQLQNMSDTLMQQTCKVMSLVAENKQLQKTLEPLRKEVADLTQGHHRMGAETYAYLCRTLAAEKRAETAERKVIELSALLEHTPELRRALDEARAENEQLRALNEKALPLSEKEYIGALKGVPLFTHRGSQLAALATLGEIKHERADLERRLTEAERALDKALVTIKRHEAELDSVLSKPKAEIDALKAKLAAAERTAATTMELEKQANFRVGDLTRELNLTKAARDTQQYYANEARKVSSDLLQELTAVRGTESMRSSRLGEEVTRRLQAEDKRAQAVRDKDAAIKQAKEWKRKYLNLRKGDPCTVEVSAEGAAKLLEKYYTRFPHLGGVFKQAGATTGRTSCAQPNEAAFHPTYKNLVDTCPLTAADLERARKAMEPLTIKVKDIQVGQWLWHDETHPSRVVNRVWPYGSEDIAWVLSQCGDVQFRWGAKKTADGYTLKLKHTKEPPK